MSDTGDYTPLAHQVRGIEELYGTKRDLLLLDNNVLASRKFTQIVRDIIDLGFHRGAKYNNQLRAVDFNQGLDARKLTPRKMRLLARTAMSYCQVLCAGEGKFGRRPGWFR